MTMLPLRWNDLADIELEILAEDLEGLGFYPERETDLTAISKEQIRRLPRAAGASAAEHRTDGHW